MMTSVQVVETSVTTIDNSSHRYRQQQSPLSTTVLVRAALTRTLRIPQSERKFKQRRKVQKICVFKHKQKNGADSWEQNKKAGVGKNILLRFAQGAHWAGWLSGAFSDFQRHWHKRRSCWAVFIKFCNLQKVNSIRIYLWWIILAAKISERNFYLICEWIIKPSLFSRKWSSSLWKGALHFEK